jgi:polyhydroxyalkanoate synthesis regulator phasin
MLRYTAILLAAGLGLAACAGPNAAQREQIEATQAVIDQKVRSGQMTPEEGRLAMAKLKAEQDAERRRNYAIMTSGDGPATYQRVGPGTVVRY